MTKSVSGIDGSPGLGIAELAAVPICQFSYRPKSNS